MSLASACAEAAELCNGVELNVGIWDVDDVTLYTAVDLGEVEAVVEGDGTRLLGNIGIEEARVSACWVGSGSYDEASV